MSKNLLVLTASIAESEPMRFTPAGIPAINFKLEHDSDVLYAGTSRAVNMAIKAIAFGALAERIAKQPIGSVWTFSGFLANAQRGKSVIFHIQDFL